LQRLLGSDFDREILSSLAPAEHGRLTLATDGEVDPGASVPGPNDPALSGWACQHDFRLSQKDLPLVSPNGAVTVVSEREYKVLGRPSCGTVAVISTGPGLTAREVGLIVVGALIGAIMSVPLGRRSRALGLPSGSK
jgi:hypothetical protein